MSESGLCGDTVASRTPRTLGLPSDLRSFLCKMGPAVTVSFHERQYCITNGSLGLTKAKKVRALGNLHTPREGDTCPDGRETGFGNVLISFLNWCDLWEDILESQIFIYIKTLSLHTFSELLEF